MITWQDDAATGAQTDVYEVPVQMALSARELEKLGMRRRSEAAAYAARLEERRERRGK